MNNPAMAHKDFSSRQIEGMSVVTDSSGLNINFYYEKVAIQNERDAEINGNVETRLCISKSPKGDRQTAVKHYITPEEAAAQYPVEFGHFQSTGEMPTSGTPLQELPGISRSQIDLLVLNGLRSIEDLVAIQEEQITPLGLSAQRAKRTAMAWHNNKSQNATMLDVADVEARYTAENGNLRKQNGEMTNQIKAMQMQITAMQAAQGVSPGQTVQQPVQTVSADDHDLETDIANMPDPFSEGSSMVDASESMGMEDIDPLG